jgi:hypothetical protein
MNFRHAYESLSFSILAFVKSRCRVITRGTPSGCPSRFRIRVGLSGNQGIDMPNSEQELAVKADERVLSEGSIN